MKLPNFILSAAVSALLGFGGAANAGGIVNVALIGEPDTLDPVISTKTVVTMVTMHIYETLYTFDENWQPQPLLAASPPEILNDGKTYRITLREGVKFHDGSDMDSADVVDSLNRWLALSSRARSFAPLVESVEADGDNVVVINLSGSYSPLVALLAFPSAGPAIFPQEIIGEDSLSATIGTGPYQLSEHEMDQYLILTRFDGYQSPDGAPSHIAGARNQIPDEIRFVPVPDSSTRLEGLLSGQFDYADSISAENYQRLVDSDVVEPVVRENAFSPFFVFNHKAGLMADFDLRKAVQYALSEEDMLIAAVGSEENYLVAASLFPEGHLWHNKAGIEEYNLADSARAGEYLAAGGYDGTPLRILTSHQYEFHFKMAEVAKVYLEAAGFNVELIVVDWATLGQKRNNPEEWDIFITHSPFLPDPALVGMYSVKSRIGWANEEKEALLAEFSRETDLAARQALFAQIQAMYFHDVPFIKIGNLNELRGQTIGMTGVPQSPWMVFWNAQVPE